jgi:hypothetical protein
MSSKFNSTVKESEQEAARNLKIHTNELEHAEDALQIAQDELEEKQKVVKKLDELFKGTESLGRKSAAWEIITRNGDDNDVFDNFVFHVVRDCGGSNLNVVMSVIDGELFHCEDGHMGPMGVVFMQFLTRVECTPHISRCFGYAFREKYNVRFFNELCLALSESPFIAECSVKILAEGEKIAASEELNAPAV